MHAPEGDNSRPLLLLAAVLAALVGSVGWWLLRSEPAPDVAGPGLQVPEAPSAARTGSTSGVPDRGPDDIPVRPAGSAELPADAGLMHPHPITAQHARIFRENNLIGELNGAMDVKDVAGLRRLLLQYRDEFPEDAHVLQEGYEIIVNCLEHPSLETRALAQRYYDEELASGLRRYIRRHCLENSN